MTMKILLNCTLKYSGTGSSTSSKESHSVTLSQVGQAQLTPTEWGTLTEALALLSKGLAAAQRASLIEPCALAAGWKAGQMAQLLLTDTSSHTGVINSSADAQTGKGAAAHQDATGPGEKAIGEGGKSDGEVGWDCLIQAGTALSGTVAGEEARAWCLRQLLTARYARIDRFFMIQVEETPENAHEICVHTQESNYGVLQFPHGHVFQTMLHMPHSALEF